MAEGLRVSIGQRLRRAVPLDWTGWSLPAGLRAATAVAVPVMIGELTSNPSFSWIAIVAFWGCLVDSGGAWRERFAAMGIFTLLSAVAALAALSAAPILWAALALTLIWSFAANITRIYGSVASTVGLLLTTDLLVNLGIPARDWHDILDRAGLTLAGGSWAMLLVLVIWRLHPYGPARRTVAACWHALGGYAEALARLHHSGARAEDWPAVIRDQRRAARDAIEAARRLLAQDRRAKAGESSRAQLILVLLADADRVFEDLIALSELLELDWERSPIAVQRAVRVALRRLAKQAYFVEHVLTERKTSTAKAPVSVITTLRRRTGDDRTGTLQPTINIINDLAEYLAGAVEVSQGVRAPRSLSDAIADRPAAPMFRWDTAVTMLRANLGFGSVAFRHALRVAATAVVAEAIVLTLSLPRGYWMTITAVVVLQPFMAATWRRSLERTVATVLGGIVAAGIGLVVHEPIVVALLVFPLSIASMALRGVNYALFVFCLTPQFILIAELFQTGGVGDWHLAGLRALDSTVGGVLGLIAGFALWPTWEAPHLPNYLSTAVLATRDYLSSVLLSGSGREAIQALRRSAGLASNNAEASLQRLMGEPGNTGLEIVEPAMMMVTCLRRISGMAAALDMAGVDRSADDKIAAMARWLSASLSALAKSIAERHSPDALAAVPREQLTDDSLISRELARAHRQVVVLHAAAARLAQSR